MTVPDPEMTIYELDTLRVMNGENVPGWVGGAAANVCCSWLKGRGYAEGFYSISQKGRDYLEALEVASGEAAAPRQVAPEFRDTANLPNPNPPTPHSEEEA